MRENLIELLSVVTCPNKICNFCEHFENGVACERHRNEVIADHLIANGVTVQKWIPVSERLPSIKKTIDGEEYMKTVAVRVEGYEVEKIAYYDDEEKLWFDTDDFPIFEKVTYWCELPEWNLS